MDTETAQRAQGKGRAGVYADDVRQIIDDLLQPVRIKLDFIAQELGGKVSAEKFAALSHEVDEMKRQPARTRAVINTAAGLTVAAATVLSCIIGPLVAGAFSVLATVATAVIMHALGR